MLYRIIDANLNRLTEGLRVVEEYIRFVLNDEKLSEKIKNLRHKLCLKYDKNYEELINSRDTINDVGVNIENITKKEQKTDILKANFKRIQQALRSLEEYSSLESNFRYEIYTIEKETMEKLNSIKKTDIKKALLKDKNIYLITNSDNFTTDDDFIDKVAQALKFGVRIVQYREKNKPASEIIEIGKKLRQLCSMYDALFIVNDRVDIAKILDADGVHLGQDDISIADARKIIGEDKIIGISTHKPDDAIKAYQNGADYIGVGPVFKTPTKPVAEPVGLEYVKWVSKNINLPFYAIGAINVDNVKEVYKAGANKVAVIREIMNSENIEETVLKLKEGLNDCK